MLIISLPCRIRTYEHEALWGKALTCYDLHASLPEATRHVGMVEVRGLRAPPPRLLQAGLTVPLSAPTTRVCRTLA